MIVLSPEELVELTGRTTRAQKRHNSQAKVLAALGVPYIARPDKTLIVYTEHAHATARPTPQAPVVAPTVCL